MIQLSMPLATPFHPALRAVTGGRRAASRAKRLADYLKDLRERSVSQWESLFEEIIGPEFFDRIAVRIGG